MHELTRNIAECSPQKFAFENFFRGVNAKKKRAFFLGWSVCEISLWRSNITPPKWRFLSFLYTLYGQDSGNNSEVAIELSMFVSRIATMWGWWKSRKANNSTFFASNATYVYACNFQFTYKVIFTCAKWRRPNFLFFCQGIKSILMF